MSEEEGLAFVAIAWALIWGLLLGPTWLAIAWSRKQRTRHAVTLLVFSYVIAMLVLLLNVRGWR